MDYSAATFGHLDHLARASLSRDALARYLAYRNAMIADGQHARCILTELSMFLWDLTAGRPGATLH